MNLHKGVAHLWRADNPGIYPKTLCGVGCGQSLTSGVLREESPILGSVDRGQVCPHPHLTPGLAVMGHTGNSLGLVPPQGHRLVLPWLPLPFTASGAQWSICCGGSPRRKSWKRRKQRETKGHDLWGKDSRSSSKAVSGQGFDLDREEQVFCPHSHYGFLFQLQSNRNLSSASLDVLLAGGLPEARTACDISLHTHALSTNNVPSPGDSQFRD